MREKFTADLKAAMRSGDKQKVGALRLVNAALKDRDIEARGQGKSVSDDDILALLQKMIKSRQESLDIFEKNNRPDLADQERGEIAVISAYLPQQLSEAVGVILGSRIMNQVVDGQSPVTPEVDPCL